jgi:tetratricopeptide (TPR) repeat protein
MKIMTKGVYCYLVAATVLLFTISCSTKPKNPTDDFSIRSQAEAALKLGITEADRNKYDAALQLLAECKRQAVLTDDPSLTIRSSLSLGNVLFALGREEEAFAEWEASVALAEELADRDLLSVSKIHLSRGSLLSGRQSPQAVLEEAVKEAANIKSDNLYIAFSWNVRGLALREMRSFTEAEKAIQRSLDIHDKDQYILKAAYDWYLIANIRSLAGNNTDGALDALNKAIANDRRMENSWGLAADWRAMGDVYRKTGKTREANKAYKRAKAIFLAIGDDEKAEEIDNRMTVE